MAIRTTDNALFEFLENTGPRKHRYHAADVELFFTENMIQLENYSVRFAAIDATFVSQILIQPLTVLSAPARLVSLTMLLVPAAVILVVFTVVRSAAVTAITAIRAFFS